MEERKKTWLKAVEQSLRLTLPFMTEGQGFEL